MNNTYEFVYTPLVKTTKDKILAILKTKPHNIHYLNRYINFVLNCDIKNKLRVITEYTEEHHICPKANDMFPEYKKIKDFQWNATHLTDRQHYLAHWMLWKSYKNASQTHAFICMSNNQNTSKQQRLVKKLNSKTYSILKADSRSLQSAASKGRASYRNKDGKIFTCSTTDPRVLSGELVSLTLGRKQKWRERTPEQIRIRNRNCSDAKWVKTPIRTAKLYFLDIRIEMNYTKGMPELIPYIDQGWSVNRSTKEYHSMSSILANKNRTVESRKRAGKSIVATSNRKNELGLKKKRIVTKEFRRSIRRIKYKNHNVLCYDLVNKTFIEVDELDVNDDPNILQCFTSGRIIFDENDNKRHYNNLLTILPPGYFEYTSKDTTTVFDTITKYVINIQTRCITEDQIKVLVPNTKGRTKVYDSLANKNSYWHKELIDKYGIPLNYTIL